jgi:hypothetical protein
VMQESTRIFSLINKADLASRAPVNSDYREVL